MSELKPWQLKVLEERIANGEFGQHIPLASISWALEEINKVTKERDEAVDIIEAMRESRIHDSLVEKFLRERGRIK